MSAVNPSQCQNCRLPLHGRFCHDCGQRERSIRRVFWALVNELLDDVFTRDSRPAHKFWSLVARPGVLTREYLDGKRARAISPVRLYLICSVIFFAVAALTNILTPHPLPEDASASAPEDGDWSGVREGLQGIAEWDSLEPATRTWLIEVFTQKLNRAEAIANEGGRAVFDQVLDVAPPVAFILLPLFALLLKLAYIRHDVFYAEHLVLALHNHSFLFLALAVGIPLDLAHEYIGPVGEALDTALELWILVYLFVSLKRVYRQSYPKTLLKYVLLFFCYGPLMFFGLMLGLLFGILTL